MLTKNSRRSTRNVTGAAAGVAVAALWTLSPVACPQQQASAALPTTTEIQWNRELLGSGRIEQLAGSMVKANKGAQESVDDSMIARFKNTLPSIEQLGSTLKYGNVVVVSSNGPEVIGLIRAVAMRKGKERNEVLARLLNYSRQGVPEAHNFSGFVYEYGLFGARRDLKLARDYYMAAAAHRYQPAIFNLANMAYFGKGQSSDPEAARELIHQAVGIGPESSGRVCGLATFIEYRRGDQGAALRYGKFCYAALAHIPNAAYNTQLPLAQRIKMLRDSIGTGAPDGYRWLETITQRAGPDPAYLYCKYRVINQVRMNRAQTDIKALSRICYENSTRQAGDNESDAAINGIVSFVATERRALEQLQQTNRFHYSWSVPYLPFSQGDADLFEPVIKETR